MAGGQRERCGETVKQLGGYKHVLKASSPITKRAREVQQRFGAKRGPSDAAVLPADRPRRQP
jgi:hypothetical protein